MYLTITNKTKSKCSKYEFIYEHTLTLLDLDKYNECKENDVLRSEVLEDFIDGIIDLYPPVDRGEVCKEIFEQAENFKKYQKNLCYKLCLKKPKNPRS